MMTHYLRSVTLLLACALLFFGGCIPSLYPIYTAEDVVTRDQILGSWRSSSDPQIWEFNRATEKAYRLVYTDNEGRSGTFVVRLTEIGDVLFMDLYPQRQGEEKPGFYNLHVVPVHTFYRIELSETRLTLSFLNPQWLKQYQAEHPDRLAHTRKENSVLLTADTASLRRFVAEHLHTEGAFTKPFVLAKASP